MASGIFDPAGEWPNPYEDIIPRPKAPVRASGEKNPYEGLFDDIVGRHSADGLSLPAQPKLSDPVAPPAPTTGGESLADIAGPPNAAIGRVVKPAISVADQILGTAQKPIDVATEYYSGLPEALSPTVPYGAGPSAGAIAAEAAFPTAEGDTGAGLNFGVIPRVASGGLIPENVPDVANPYVRAAGRTGTRLAVDLARDPTTYALGLANKTAREGQAVREAIAAGGLDADAFAAGVKPTLEGAARIAEKLPRNITSRQDILDAIAAGEKAETVERVASAAFVPGMAEGALAGYRGATDERLTPVQRFEAGLGGAVSGALGVGALSNALREVPRPALQGSNIGPETGLVPAGVVPPEAPPLDVQQPDLPRIAAGRPAGPPMPEEPVDAEIIPRPRLPPAAPAEAPVPAPEPVPEPVAAPVPDRYQTEKGMALQLVQNGLELSPKTLVDEMGVSPSRAQRLFRRLQADGVPLRLEAGPQPAALLPEAPPEPPQEAIPAPVEAAPVPAEIPPPPPPQEAPRPAEDDLAAAVREAAAAVPEPGPEEHPAEMPPPAPNVRPEEPIPWAAKPEDVKRESRQGIATVNVPTADLLRLAQEDINRPGRARQQVGPTDKLTRAKHFISRAELTGEPVQTPEISVQGGKVVIDDGYHRTQAAADAGQETVPVRIPREDVAKLRDVGLSYRDLLTGARYDAGAETGRAGRGVSGPEARPAGTGEPGVGNVPQEGVGRVEGPVQGRPEAPANLREQEAERPRAGSAAVAPTAPSPAGAVHPGVPGEGGAEPLPVRTPGRKLAPKAPRFPKDAEGQNVYPEEAHLSPEARRALTQTVEARVAELRQSQNAEPTGRRPLVDERGNPINKGRGTGSEPEYTGVPSHKAHGLENIPEGPKRIVEAIKKDKGNALELRVREAVLKGDGELQAHLEDAHPPPPEIPRPALRPVTPQVPNEPGAKYVLPSFATGRTAPVANVELEKLKPRLADMTQAQLRKAAKFYVGTNEDALRAVHEEQRRRAFPEKKEEAVAATKPAERAPSEPEPAHRPPAGNAEALEGVPAEGVRRQTEGREPREVPAEGGGGNGGPVPRPSDVGDAIRPSVGDGEGPVADPGEPPAEVAPPRHEQRVSRGIDYRITDKDELGAGGAVGKARGNVEAIKLLKKLEEEKRLATPEEQAKLVKYVGWGQLPNAFEPWRASDSSAAYREVYDALQELLTPEEFAAAKRSTQNAHFTSKPVVDAMWSALERLGVGKRASILEPAVGTGNFLGLQPSRLMPAKRTAVEMDPITSRIAQQLYQNATVINKPFQETELPRDFYDVVTSNVPFANVGVHDPTFKKTPAVTGSIHDYYFAKALDLARPGGLVSFITSHYTMDKQDPAVRKYIADRADLLGAIRLPNTAFKKNAGTEVVTDMIFLRKRAPGEQPAGQAWQKLGSAGEGIKHNEYFVEHPDMVLGTPSLEGSMYAGKDEYTVAGDLTPEALAKAVEKLPKDAFSAYAKPIDDVEAQRTAIPIGNDRLHNGSFLVGEGGKLQVRNGEFMEPAQVPEAAVPRIKGMIPIRKALHSYFDQQLADKPEADITKARRELNQTYDAFVKKHGPISAPANVKAFREDPSLPALTALEKYDKKTGKAEKMPVFSQRTIKGYTPPEKAQTAHEALGISLAEFGKLDWKRMEGLLGKDREAIQRELGDRVFQNPDKGGWETRDAYLSGNVREKLRLAEAAAGQDAAFERNVEALRAVQPADLEPGNITVKLGTPWLPPEDIAQFIGDLLGEGYRNNRTQVWRNAEAGSWAVKDVNGLKRRSTATDAYGTPQANAMDLIADSLNQRATTIRAKDADGNEFVDPVATAAARDKQDKIQEAFKDWIWKDRERTDRLVGLYNRDWNNLKDREYDGSHLQFPGMAKGHLRQGKLDKHQIDQAWRVIQMPSGGSTLANHAVGSGKTFTHIAAVMELRRTGVVQKPMFPVPNHLVSQWAKHFRQLYPLANILVAGKETWGKGIREKTMARIATGDWDAVIVSHASMTKIPMKRETRVAFLEEQIGELEQAIRGEEAALGASEAKRSRTVKQLEAAKDKLAVKIKDLMEKAHQDSALNFEDLGVDMMVVDEAHGYKNLMTPSRLQVAGISKAGSAKALDMFMKARWMANRGGRLAFLTATPVSNTLGEAYVFQKFLQPDVLRDHGLQHFDSWAGQFGAVVPSAEQDVSGRYRVASRFAAFNNVPELSAMMQQFMDTKLPEDLKLEKPTLKGGKPIVHVSPGRPELKAFVKLLQERADDVKSGRVDPKDDNMLKISTDGRKAALAMRLVAPWMEEEPEGKIAEATRTIAEIYKRKNDDKATQIVFLDLSTPKEGEAEGAAKAKEKPEAEDDSSEEQDPTAVELEAEAKTRGSVYAEIKKRLVAGGIPENEIRFSHDAKNDIQRSQLYDDMNSGKVRVLLASSEKGGTGMNVQERLYAIHHIDSPWRPDQFEQRNGRILRQGNMFKEVEEHRYVTGGSFDAYMWQTLERKARFVHDFMTAKGGNRTIEDVGAVVLDAAQMKAAASGDPRLLERVVLENEIGKLETLKRAHQASATNRTLKLRGMEADIPAYQKALKNAEADAAAMVKPENRPFGITVEGRKFDARKDAGEFLLQKLQKAKELEGELYGRPFTIGVKGIHEGRELARGEIEGPSGATYPFSVGDDPVGVMRSMENAWEDAPARDRDKFRGHIATLERDLATLKGEAGKPFDREEKLAQKKARLKELTSELEAESKAPAEGEQAPPKTKEELRQEATLSDLRRRLEPKGEPPDRFARRPEPVWAGSASALDGRIEEMHPRSTAEASDFHHSKYFSPEQVEKLKNGENVFFWRDRDGRVQTDWRDGEAPKWIVSKIQDQLGPRFARRPAPGQMGLEGIGENVAKPKPGKPAPPKQTSMFGGEMLQPSEANVTEGREGEGPLFRQEQATQDQREAGAQTGMFQPNWSGRIWGDLPKLNGRREWQMPLDEWVTRQNTAAPFRTESKAFGRPALEPGKPIPQWIIDMHKDRVRRALEMGYKVPEGILKTYPDLEGTALDQEAIGRREDYRAERKARKAAEAAVVPPSDLAKRTKVAEASEIPISGHLSLVNPTNRSWGALRDLAPKLEPISLAAQGVANRLISLAGAKGANFSGFSTDGDFFGVTLHGKDVRLSLPAIRAEAEARVARKGGNVNRETARVAVNKLLHEIAHVKAEAETPEAQRASLEAGEGHGPEYQATLRRVYHAAAPELPKLRRHLEDRLAQNEGPVKELLKVSDEAWKEAGHGHYGDEESAGRAGGGSVQPGGAAEPGLDRGHPGGGPERGAEPGGGVSGGGGERVQPEGRPPVLGGPPEETRFARRQQAAPGALSIPEETFLEHLDRFAADKFSRLRTVERAAGEQGGRPGKLTEMLSRVDRQGGLIAHGIETLQRDMVDPMIEKLSKAKANVSDLGDYLALLHKPDRDAEIARRTEGKVKEGSGWKQADADARWKELEAKYGKRVNGRIGALEPAAKDVRKMRDFELHTLRDGGLISADQEAAWRASMGPDYVPLRGELDDISEDQPASSRLGRGLDIRGKESPLATGRSTVSANPVGNMLRQAERAVIRAERNKAAQKFADFVRDNDLYEMDKTHTTQRFGSSAKTKDILVGAGDPLKAADDFSYKVDGEKHRITITDPLVDRALKNMSAQDAGAFVHQLGKATRLYSAMQTSFNPEFIATNFVRDIQEASINVSAEQGAKIAAQMVKDIPNAMRGMLNEVHDRGKTDEWSRAAREFKQDGGPIGFYQLKDAADLTKALEARVSNSGPGYWKTAKRAVSAIGNEVVKMNEVVENGTRLAVYKALRDSGVPRAKAALISKGATLNFEKKGEAGPFFNALWAFFNANAQGAKRLMQVMNTRTGKGIAAGLVAAGFAYDRFNRANAGDQNGDGRNDWDDVPDYVKDKNFVFMRSKGHPIMFPMPYGWGAVFGMGRTMSSVVAGKKSPAQGAMSMAGNLWNAFTPPPLSGAGSLYEFAHGLAPTFVQPFLEHGANKDFTGRQIVPEQRPGEPTKPPSELYGRGVSPVSKWITDHLNKLTGGDKVTPGYISVSPEIVDFYAKWLGGGMGKTTMNTLSTGESLAKGEAPSIRNTPFVRRFVYEESPGREGQVYREELQKARTLVSAKKQYERSDDPAMNAKGEALPQEALDAAGGILDIDNDIRDLRKTARDEGDPAKYDTEITDLEKRALRLAERAKGTEIPEASNAP